MSNKIMRAYVEEESSLLSEVSALTKLKDLFTSKSKRDESPDDFAYRASGSGTATSQVIKTLLEVPTGEARLIISLNFADWNSVYHSNSGNIKLIKALDSGNPGAIYSAFPKMDDPENRNSAQIFKVVDDLSLSNQISLGNKIAVLINIKSQFADYFRGNKEPGDYDEALDILEKAVDHRNYIAALDVEKVKTLGQSVLSSTNSSEVARELDLNSMIIDFAPASLLKAAQVEFDQLQNTKNNTTGAETLESATEKIITFIENKLASNNNVLPNKESAKRKLAKDILSEINLLTGNNSKLRRQVIAAVIENYPSQEVAKAIKPYLLGAVTDINSNKISKKDIDEQKVTEAVGKLITFIESQIVQYSGFPEDENDRKEFAKAVRLESKKLISNDENSRRVALLDALNTYPIKNVGILLKSYIYSGTSTNTATSSLPTETTVNTPQPRETTVGDINSGSIDSAVTQLKKAFNITNRNQLDNLLKGINDKLGSKL